MNAPTEEEQASKRQRRSGPKSTTNYIGELKWQCWKMAAAKRFPFFSLSDFLLPRLTLPISTPPTLSSSFFLSRSHTVQEDRKV